MTPKRRAELCNPFGSESSQAGPLNASINLEDLRVPPSNHLEKLRGNLAGLYSVRINDQYRLVFRFMNGHASDVRCTDYH